MKEPFRRYETLAGVEYEILSSDLENYYKVPMLGLQAMSCECRFARYNPTCKHQTWQNEKKLFIKVIQLRMPVAKSPCSVIAENQSIGFASLARTIITFARDANGMEKATTSHHKKLQVA